MDRREKGSTVITRMSELFVRTLRDDPADAEVPSHRWLVRAGYIRRAAPGIYSWLPLGYKVLRNVERIVREEMDAIGAQEVHLPALLPREPYEATGRWTEYGPNIFRLQDRKGGDYLLGPTHEEMFALLVKDLYSSYKDLPLSLYQIQTKYRDEARPRAGILRGREFVMKDSYSFDIDDVGLAEVLRAHRDAYVKIFNRLGFYYVIVHAMSGAMGGSASEEFLAVAENGEDTFVALRRAATPPTSRPCTWPRPTRCRTTTCRPRTSRTPPTPRPSRPWSTMRERRASPRDDRPWTAADTLKNVLVMVRKPDGSREPLAIGLPGDREVDLKRLGAQVEPAEAEPFTEEDFADHPGLVKGYIGPGVLGAEYATGIRYLVDPRVVTGTRWVTGADTAAGTSSTWSPAATSPRTACSRRPRSGRATRPRTAPVRCSWPAASRWATSSSSAASTPRRSGSRCWTRTASSSPSPWAPTASGSPAPSPPWPRAPATRTVCAGRGSSRRTTCRSWPPARATTCSTRPPTWPASSTTPASACCWTTARPAPG